MPKFLVDVDVSIHMTRTYRIDAGSIEEAEQHYSNGVVVGESNTSGEFEEIESSELDVDQDDSV